MVIAFPIVTAPATSTLAEIGEHIVTADTKTAADDRVPAGNEQQTITPNVQSAPRFPEVGLPVTSLVGGYLQKVLVATASRLSKLSAAVPIRAVFLLIVVAILLRFFSLSTVGLYRWFVPPDGFIFVDSPEVYTRERLINERSSEESWLNKKLNETDSTDSLAGINHLIERHLGAGSQGDGSSTKQSDGDSGPSPNLKTADYLTFDQKVRLQTANRDFILQKIVENRLDDRHDLAGNSLYILKFDTTVVASQLSSQKALVRIGLIPPLVPSRNTDPSLGIFGAVLGIDQTTSNFMNGVFRELVLNIAARVNRAVKAAKSATNKTSDTAVSAIASEVAKEFGSSQDEVKIAPLPQEYIGPTLLQFTLDFAGIGDVIRVITIAKDPNLTDFPTFSSAERKVKVSLLESACQLGAKEGHNYPDRFRLAETALLDARHAKLRKYFRVQADNEKQALRFYSSIDGYAFISDRNQKGFLTLLEDSLTNSDPALPIASNFVQNIALVEEKIETHNKEPKEDTIITREGSVPTCRRIDLTLRAGFVNFINRARNFNNYTYSALPRQSPVAIIDDIISSVQIRFPSAANWGGWDLLGLSASEKVTSKSSSLRSRVTSFGDLASASSANSGDLSVGWIIDPLAGAPPDRQDELVSSSESVMAIVSVPSWWPYLKLRIVREWLGSNGNVIPALFAPNFANSDTGADSESYNVVSSNDRHSGSEYIVNLPNLRHALDAVIMRNDDRQPSIASVTCNELVPTTGEVNKSVPNCVIEGNRLWRNPVVFAGAARNSYLNVLPNMNGLLVQFDPGVRTCGEKLSVWTSEGVARTDLPGCRRDAAVNIDR